MAKPPSSQRSNPRPGKLPRIGPYALITEMSGGALGSRWAGYVAKGDERGRLVSARRVEVPGKKSQAEQWLYDAGERAQSIRHSKVSAVLDVVREKREIVIVSEFVEGEVLSSLLRLAVMADTPIPAPVALCIVRDLIEALIAARERWCELAQGETDPLRLAIYGGLCPEAAVVAGFGEAMLLDVGVAGAAARLPRILKHPAALPYRAPEQLKHTFPVDERTDVFSAGVMLWEMLASRPLFGTPDRLRHPESDHLDDSQVRALEDEIVDKRIPLIDAVRRAGAPVRMEVVGLLAQALERHPAERFESLESMLQALQELPGDTLASGEQVAVALDRLARSVIDTRRAAIEMATGGRVMESTPPESSRSTARPEPPSKPIPVLVPPMPMPGVVKISGLAQEQFSPTEAPTAPRSAPQAPPKAQQFADTEAPTTPSAGRPAPSEERAEKADEMPGATPTRKEPAEAPPAAAPPAGIEVGSSAAQQFPVTEATTTPSAGCPAPAVRDAAKAFGALSAKATREEQAAGPPLAIPVRSFKVTTDRGLGPGKAAPEKVEPEAAKSEQVESEEVKLEELEPEEVKAEQPELESAEPQPTDTATAAAGTAPADQAVQDAQALFGLDSAASSDAQALSAPPALVSLPAAEARPEPRRALKYAVIAAVSLAVTVGIVMLGLRARESAGRADEAQESAPTAQVESKPVVPAEAKTASSAAPTPQVPSAAPAEPIATTKAEPEEPDEPEEAMPEPPIPPELKPKPRPARPRRAKRPGKARPAPAPGSDTFRPGGI